VFDDTRARFHAKLESMPIACQAYRLHTLGRIAQQTEDMENIALVMQVMDKQRARLAACTGRAMRRQPGPRLPRCRRLRATV
jgi:hypothetical protein